ncbi:MurR/RpiR family transcriptional regulator [Exilibacterium tricleocarpae]|uniref:MurR/RpiR family transcriptional regulator n=1 Tax=Exilibacterium tricleocarpae TaxID=2591008 RepID=A0A545TW20_9GAMM|nr:MurR/RpiR family transcriptional regulator [Exilibacterium tricleocarpae]TQV81361.1 MurR/RpiR family transcriptional regulator [Exilibacterium tricleocarpae]
MTRAKTLISESINGLWAELSTTDRKVGRVLLGNYPMAGLQTLAAVSEQAGVSSPTVMRFVKKLGFAGYPEFQKALHLEIADLLDNKFSPGAPAASVRHLPGRITGLCTHLVDDIQRGFSRLQEAELVGAARMLADLSNEVSLIGGRVSTPLAHGMYRRLMLLRPGCTPLSADPLERTEKLMTTGRRDTLVVFDPSPYDSDLGAFTRLAAERGAQIILFSDGETPPVARQAKFVFSTPAPSADYAATVAITCLIEALLAETQRLIGRSADQRLRELRQIYT